jgi:hypothetical protein
MLVTVLKERLQFIDRSIRQGYFFRNDTVTFYGVVKVERFRSIYGAGWRE